MDCCYATIANFVKMLICGVKLNFLTNFKYLGHIIINKLSDSDSWLTVGLAQLVERRSSAGVLSLFYARLAADG